MHLRKENESMQGSVWDYFYLHSLFLLYSFGGICSKLAGQAGVRSIRFWLFYGVLLLVLIVYALAWQQILKKLPLVTAYANKSVTIIWGMVWGALLFHERITLKQICGAAVIMAGILLVVKKDE